MADVRTKPENWISFEVEEEDDEDDGSGSTT
jgi:hypothetical protein